MGEQSSGILLSEIAAYIGAELVGASPDTLVSSLASLSSARPTDLSFVVSAKNLSQAQQSSAGVLICPPKLLESLPGLALLVHPQPYLAYARVSELFAYKNSKQGISDLATVSDQAEVGEGVYIGPYSVVESGAKIADGCCIDSGCYIGAKVEIGKKTKLFPRVTIYHEVVIGSNCRINSGTVIGSDGFGFAPTDQGWVKIHQLGKVIVGDNVDIGANVSISRGALDDTRIGTGVIIDDLVLIAHNVEIGDHTALAGQIGIAGSTKVGARCSMGGQVAVTGHIEIADDVHITGKSMVTRSISDAGQYSSGMPVAPANEWRRNTVRLRQIEQLVDRISELEKQIKDKATD